MSGREWLQAKTGVVKLPHLRSLTVSASDALEFYRVLSSEKQVQVAPWSMYVNFEASGRPSAEPFSSKSSHDENMSCCIMSRSQSLMGQRSHIIKGYHIHVLVGVASLIGPSTLKKVNAELYFRRPKSEQPQGIPI